MYNKDKITFEITKIPTASRYIHMMTTVIVNYIASYSYSYVAGTKT